VRGGEEGGRRSVKEKSYCAAAKEDCVEGKREGGRTFWKAKRKKKKGRATVKIRERGREQLDSALV